MFGHSSYGAADSHVAYCFLTRSLYYTDNLSTFQVKKKTKGFPILPDFSSSLSIYALVLAIYGELLKPSPKILTESLWTLPFRFTYLASNINKNISSNIVKNKMCLFYFFVKPTPIFYIIQSGP